MGKKCNCSFSELGEPMLNSDYNVKIAQKISGFKSPKSHGAFSLPFRRNKDICLV